MCESIYKDEEGFNAELINDNYKHNIRFDLIYFDEWKYCFWDGVGLKFEGIPYNEKEFVEYLQDQSCNPVMSHIICDELIDKGIRYCTVMSHLNFNKIHYDLLKMGVKMSIVKPAKMKDNGLFFKSCSLATSLLTHNKGKSIKEVVKQSDGEFDEDSLFNLVQNNFNYLVIKIKERNTGLGKYK